MKSRAKSCNDMGPYKVLFADLDGTLINTASGGTFPKGIWDMKFRLDVFEAIKKLNPEMVCIVTNQGGIELGNVYEESFIKKIEYVCQALSDYIEYPVYYGYCTSNNKNCIDRKPNTGLLDDFYSMFVEPSGITKDECLMIGDASGLPGQFSDSDMRTAKNFGCDYIDVDSFVM